MKLFNFYGYETSIYPGERDLVNFWTAKWGVSKEQLHEAIIETGSIDTRKIKTYLINKGFVFSFFGVINYIKLLVN